MDDRVDAVVAAVDAKERLERLTEVGEIDAGERDGWIPGCLDVEVQDVVVVREQVGDHRSPELPAPAGDCDAHARNHTAAGHAKAGHPP